jgi:hypothetical protein
VVPPVTPDERSGDGTAIPTWAPTRIRSGSGVSPPLRAPAGTRSLSARVDGRGPGERLTDATRENLDPSHGAAQVDAAVGPPLRGSGSGGVDRSPPARSR